MIHIIRFAGELNVFHYCHSSEEVGGEGRRGCRRRSPRGTALLSRPPTLSLSVREGVRAVGYDAGYSVCHSGHLSTVDTAQSAESARLPSACCLRTHGECVHCMHAPIDRRVYFEALANPEVTSLRRRDVPLFACHAGHPTGVLINSVGFHHRGPEYGGRGWRIETPPWCSDSAIKTRSFSVMWILYNRRLP
ncbi:unnamed protein product, partial [Iphiclides podalirius]